MQTQTWAGSSIGLICLAIGAGLLLLLLVACVIVWIKVRRFVRGVAQAHVTPPRITLNPLPPAAHEEGQEVKAVTAHLREARYEQASDYSIVEMPGLVLRSMINPHTSTCAVVYTHPTLGVWCDLYAKYADGTSLTVTNAPMGGELDSIPGRQKIFRKGAPLEQLLTLFNAALEPKEKVAITAETFAPTFEKTYEEDTLWRLQRGGPTQAEVQRVAANMEGSSFTEKEVAAAHAHIASASALQLADLCRESFTRTTPLDPDLRDSTVIIHDQMPPAVVLEIFADNAGFEVEELPPVTATTSRAIFDELNRLTPGGPFFTRLGEVTEPVHADVWLDRTESPSP